MDANGDVQELPLASPSPACHCATVGVTKAAHRHESKVCLSDEQLADSVAASSRVWSETCFRHAYITFGLPSHGTSNRKRVYNLHTGRQLFSSASFLSHRGSLSPLSKTNARC